MAEQAEASHVGEAMDGIILCERRADAIQERRRGDHFIVSFGREYLLFEGGRIDANAQCLGEDERIPWLCIGVATNLRLGSDADDSEPIDRLDAVDRMPPRHRK